MGPSVVLLVFRASRYPELDMTITDEPAQTSGVLRRHWLVVVLLFGLIFFVSAVVLGKYLDDRIVLLGPVDAFALDVVLAEAAVWCIAAFLIGCLVKVARGPWPILFVRNILATVIMFGALGLALIIGVGVSLLVGVDNQYKLDTPKDSPEYIVSTIIPGETNLTLYRGNGIVYDRLSLSLPFPDHQTSFATSHRVETDPSGQSFLIYPQGVGGDARVPLPRN